MEIKRSIFDLERPCVELREQKIVLEQRMNEASPDELHRLAVIYGGLSRELDDIEHEIEDLRMTEFDVSASARRAKLGATLAKVNRGMDHAERSKRRFERNGVDVEREKDKLMQKRERMRPERFDDAGEAANGGENKYDPDAIAKRFLESRQRQLNASTRRHYVPPPVDMRSLLPIEAQWAYDEDEDEDEEDENPAGAAIAVSGHSQTNSSS